MKTVFISLHPQIPHISPTPFQISDLLLFIIVHIYIYIHTSKNL